MDPLETLYDRDLYENQGLSLETAFPEKALGHRDSTPPLVSMCWVCVIFFPRLAPRTVRCAGRSRGFTREEAAPTVGVRGSASAKIVLVCGPTHRRTHPCFVHEFAHGFGVRWFSAPGIL